MIRPMEQHDQGFGRITGFDPRLREDPETCRRLHFRERLSDRLLFFSPQGRMVTMTGTLLGSGPDRLLCEHLPPVDASLPIEGWTLNEAGFTLPNGFRLSLSNAKPLRTDTLTPARDYPGHMRRILKRSMKQISQDGAIRLFELGHSLQQALAEIVEAPILRVLGFNPDPANAVEAGESQWKTDVPAGDQALCGMLLTGRAFLLGKRLRIDWFGRLAMEIRRFQHRTTRQASALLHFAAEGRITQSQERFFNALARDYEGAVEAAWLQLRENHDGGGPWFLAGVATALEMIFQDFFQQMNRSGAGKPLPTRNPPSSSSGSDRG